MSVAALPPAQTFSTPSAGAPAVSSPPSASAPPSALAPRPSGATAPTADTYQAAPVQPAAVHTPAQARIAAQYKASALRDVADPATLEVLNKALKDNDPQAKPLTPAEAKGIINNTEVRVLSKEDYRAVKSALSESGLRDNPAAAASSGAREAMATEGPERLATARARERTGLRDTKPTQAEIDQARADLQRIDPGAFKKPPQDAVYVNEAKAGVPVSDPTKTKVADHEFVHTVLTARAPGMDPEAQHRVIGKLGWNQAVPGENFNWATPPGQGLPK